jgi:predicted amidohydrolase YtcJ
MRIKFVIPIAVALFLLTFVFYHLHKSRSATLLLFNGVVYTLNEQRPRAEAIAIAGERILAVGTNEEIKGRYEAPQLIDLKGHAVYPGFTDAHAHLEGLGALLVNINLSGTTSVEQIQSLVAERVATASAGSWIRGRSWDQNRWAVKSFPTHHMLDHVAGEHPVALTRVDGHALWVNKKALDMASITRRTPDPDGGKIVRDREGNPTGVLVDNAMALIDSVMPAPSEAERTEASERAVQECLKVGLTQVHDMGTDLELIGIYKKLIQAKKFPFRVYVAIDGVGETWNHYAQRGPEIGGNENKLTVRAIKLYADGALGSRGAALIEPYADDPTNRGLTLTPTETLRSVAADALSKGFQVCTHAIGDRANHIVLNVYEEVFKQDQVKAEDARFRVEHAQIVDVADIPRFHKLGVLPSMQPTHCTSDMYWAEARLGARRMRGAYAWRSFLSAGSIIPAGSDFPVEGPNPLWGFYAAITRQDASGWPADGWYAGERMQRDEALKAFTTWAAFAAFEETARGSIREGKLADLVVLSHDIMTCVPKEILATQVLYTIVGGEIAYSAAASVP